MAYGLRPRQRFSSPPDGDDNNTPDKTKHARRLRRAETPSERKLWQALRRKQVRDVRFRRQHPMGPYFADFVCLRAKLVVEVDGASHDDPKEIAYDLNRTRWLEREGYKVLRFWSSNVLANLEGVIRVIDREVEERLRSVPAKFAPVAGE